MAIFQKRSFFLFLLFLFRTNVTARNRRVHSSFFGGTAAFAVASPTKQQQQQQQQQQGSSSSSSSDENNRNLHSTTTTTKEASSSSSSWLDGLELEDYDYGKAANNQQEDFAHNSQILNSLQTHPLLQIPCRLTLDSAATTTTATTTTATSSNSRPIRCFCDTGAQKTVMGARAANEAGLMAYLDRRYAASHAVGVGGSTCRVLGRIPPGVATLHMYNEVEMPSPAIVVLEDLCGVDLLLGLDFLREHDAVLDLRDEELQLTVQKRTVRVPFIKPRNHPIGEGFEGPQQQQNNNYYAGGPSRTRLCSSLDADMAEMDHSDFCDFDEDEEEDEEESSFQGRIDMSGV